MGMGHEHHPQFRGMAMGMGMGGTPEGAIGMEYVACL
jgi:hypothetical protein